MLNFLGGLSANSDPERFFNTAHLKTDVKRRSVRSGAITIIGQGTKFLSQTAGTLILARLLSPEDFGLIGMVAVVFHFIEPFKDLGLAAATVQREKITHAQVSTLFWINTGISSAITLITAALAPLMAKFYNEPRIISIMMLLAIALLLGGLSVQHRAILRRQMKFGVVSKIDVLSVVVGIIAAIISAYYGAGYWALVIWRLVQATTSLLGAWLSCGWRPGLPKLHSGTSSMVAFGASIMGFRVINYFARNTDNILIGRFQGAQALGVYSIAYRLLLMPIQQINTPITSVALPVLSRLQDNPKKFTSYYYKALLLITSISMPIIGFLFADVDNLVKLFLGIKWIESVNIFKLLAPAAFVGTVKVCLGWAFISLGQVNRQLRQGVVSSLITVTGFFIGVHWGESGVATAYSITEPIVVLASLVYCYQQTPMTLGGFINYIRFPSISAIGAAFGILGIRKIINLPINIGLNILLDILIYSILYFTIWIIIPRGKESLYEVISTAKSIKI